MSAEINNLKENDDVNTLKSIEVNLKRIECQIDNKNLDFKNEYLNLIELFNYFKNDSNNNLIEFLFIKNLNLLNNKLHTSYRFLPISLLNHQQIQTCNYIYNQYNNDIDKILDFNKHKFYLKINFFKLENSNNIDYSLFIYQLNDNTKNYTNKIEINLKNINKSLIEFEFLNQSSINLMFLLCNTYDNNGTNLNLPLKYFYIKLQKNNNFLKNFNEKFKNLLLISNETSDFEQELLYDEIINFDIFNVNYLSCNQNLFLNNQKFFFTYNNSFSSNNDNKILSLCDLHLDKCLYLYINSINFLCCNNKQLYYIEIKNNNVTHCTYAFNSSLNETKFLINLYSLNNNFFDNDFNSEFILFNLYKYNALQYRSELMCTKRFTINYQALLSENININFDDQTDFLLNLSIKIVFPFELKEAYNATFKKFYYFYVNFLLNNSINPTKQDSDLFDVINEFSKTIELFGNLNVILCIRKCLYYAAYIKSRLLIVKLNEHRQQFKECLNILNDILLNLFQHLDHLNYSDYGYLYEHINDLNKNLIINCLIDYLKEYNSANLNVLYLYLNLILSLTMTINNNQNIKLIVKYEFNNFFIKFLQNYDGLNLNFYKILQNFSIIYSYYDLYELICLKLLNLNYLKNIDLYDFFLNNVFELDLFINNFEFRDRILAFILKLIQNQTVYGNISFDLLNYMLNNRTKINKKFLDDHLKSQFKDLVYYLHKNVRNLSNCTNTDFNEYFVDFCDFHIILQNYLQSEETRTNFKENFALNYIKAINQNISTDHLRKYFLVFIDSLDYILQYSSHMSYYIDIFETNDFIYLFDFIESCYFNMINNILSDFTLLKTKIDKILTKFLIEIKTYLIKFISKLTINESTKNQTIEILIWSYFRLIFTSIKQNNSSNTTILLNSLTSSWLMLNTQFKKSSFLSEYVIINIADLKYSEDVVNFFSNEFNIYLKTSLNDIFLVLAIFNMIKNRNIDKRLINGNSNIITIENLCINFLNLDNLNVIEKSVVLFNLFKLLNESLFDQNGFKNIYNFKYVCELNLLKSLYKLYKFNKYFYEMAVVSKCIGDIYMKYDFKHENFQDLKLIYYLKSLKKFNFNLLNHLQLESGNFSSLNVYKLESFLNKITGFSSSFMKDYQNFEIFLDKVNTFIKILKNMNSLNKNRVTNLHYRIGFFGAYNLLSIKNKYFLYSHTNYEILSNIQNEFLELFDNKPIILNYNQEPNKYIKENHENIYLQICTLKCITKKDLLDLIENYLDDVENLKTIEILVDSISSFKDDYEIFYYDKPFYKSALYTPIECIENLWIERNLFMINNVYEDFLKLNEIKHYFKLYLNPLFNAINDINDKTSELKEFLLKFNLNTISINNNNINNTKILTYNSIIHNMQPLTMRLLGCLDAPIHGGLMVYIRKFLNERYLNTFNFNSDRKRKLLVYKLYYSIKKQLVLLESCLSLHNRLIIELDKNINLLTNNDASSNSNVDNSVLENYNNMKKLNEHLISCLKLLQNELHERWSVL